MMNREQRRKYARQMKNDRAASICPKCGTKARFISTKKDDVETALICECCGENVRQGADITKAVPPGIRLPLTLELLDAVLKENIENDEQE